MPSGESPGGNRPVAVEAVHLDPLGGVAGDMFCAALLDARPDLWPVARAAVAALNLHPSPDVALERACDGQIGGVRFAVRAADGDPAAGTGGRGHRWSGSTGHHAHVDDRAHAHGDDHEQDHGHTAWRDVRALIERAGLKPAVRDQAIGIFALLAEAEGTVHRCPPDAVTFHEVGAVDSIVDIVTAAALIDALGAEAWSIGALPRGRGLVHSQHGMLPVPAPAAAYLLRDFVLYDDGEAGERITPTGAAILAWLRPRQEPDPTPRRLLASGTGLGQRQLAGRANLLRASLYTGAAMASDDAVSVLRFEVDDQSPEDLALGLDALRQLDGVLDVCQWPAFAKKGRMTAAIQVLARPDCEARAIDAAFRETTTLGVRRSRAVRSVLPRQSRETPHGPVKLARRPDGRWTGKLEADALCGVPDAAARADRRLAAQAAAGVAEVEIDDPAD